MYVRYGDPAYPYNTPSRLYGAGSESDGITRWAIEVDWNNDGIFDGSNEAKYTIGLSTDRGRQSYIRVSDDDKAVGFEHVQIGRAVITFKNLNDRFTPGNTSSDLYPNVQRGRAVRIRSFYNGVFKPIMAGKIADVKVFTGKRNQVQLVVEGAMKKLATADTKISVQQNVDIDDAIGLILDEAGWPTLWGRSLEDTSDVLSYWWSNNKAITEINNLADAELGVFFEAADGKATYYSRHHSNTPILTLTQEELSTDIEELQPREVIRNKINVISHPPILRTSVVLWTLADTPLILAGESLNSGNGVFATYQYNNNAVSAVNVITPAPTTDYLVNTAPDGSGIDLTSSCTVTEFTDFGTASKIIIENNSLFDGYLVLLKVRGDAIDQSSPSRVTIEDTDSQDDFEVLEFTLDSEWLQSTGLANDIARWLNSFMPLPQNFLRVKLRGRPDIQYEADLFSVVDQSIAKKGIDRNFKIIFIKHNWINDNGQDVETTWYYEPFPDSSGFWIFDALTGNVEMGVNTNFGL